MVGLKHAPPRSACDICVSILESQQPVLHRQLLVEGQGFPHLRWVSRVGHKWRVSVVGGEKQKLRGCDSSGQHTLGAHCGRVAGPLGDQCQTDSLLNGKTCSKAAGLCPQWASVSLNVGPLCASLSLSHATRAGPRPWLPGTAG